MNPLAFIGYSLLALALLHGGFVILLLFHGSQRSSLRRVAAALTFWSAAYCAMAGIAYVRASLGLSFELFYRACWAGWLSLAPSIELVHRLRSPNTPLPLHLRLCGYPFWGALFVLSMTTDLVEGGADNLLPFVDKTGPLEPFARLAGAAMIGWVLVGMYQIRKVSVGKQRQQVAYLLLGLAIYGTGGATFSGIFPFVGIPWDPALTAFFSGPWMALTFYAATRHRLFDFRIVLSRLITAAILISSLAVLQVGLFVCLEESLGAIPAVLVAALTTGLVLFLSPVVKIVRDSANRLMLGDVDHHRVMKESAQALVSILSLQDLLRRIVDITRQSLKIDAASMLLRTGDEFELQYAFGVDAQQEALESDPLGRGCGFAAPGALPPVPPGFFGRAPSADTGLAGMAWWSLALGRSRGDKGSGAVIAGTTPLPEPSMYERRPSIGRRSPC